MATKGNVRVKPATVLSLPIDPRLKELIGLAADADQLPMNEWVAEVLARELNRPDLAGIPRLPLGRPRNKMPVVEARNGKRKAVAR